MKKERLVSILEAGELSDLDELNRAVREASTLADTVIRSHKVIVDPQRPLVSVRNFTKTLEGIPTSGNIRTYALVEIDEGQEK